MGMRGPGNVAISPDGSTVAWTLRSRDGSTLHLLDVASPATDKTIAIPNGSGCAYSSPIWSPDGATLAFLGACAPESKDPTVPRQSQVYLWSKSTGDIKQLTHVTGDINQPAWSPDGKAIAFLFVENATRTAGALDAMKPWSGVIGEDGVEVQRVYNVDSTSGTGAFITPINLHVYEFDWSPDSHLITFVAAAPPGENNWWVAKLYTESLGSEPKVVLDPSTVAGSLHGLQIAVPRWSPDASQIAFIGGLMSDQGSTGGDIYLLNANGGTPRDITPGIPNTPTWLSWLGHDRLGFSDVAAGKSSFEAIQPSTGHIESLLGPLPESIGDGRLEMSLSLSKNGEVAFLATSFEHAPEVYEGRLGQTPHALTHVNDDHAPLWGQAKSVEWTNEGFHVQGWLLLPAHYDPAKKYPLIVYVHGGPSAANMPRWPGVGYGPVPFSALDYFVLMPNPRGSFGEGERFTQANRKDFGYGDLRDILAGVDAVEKQFPVDNHRVGVTGWSYGGFMTLYTTTRAPGLIKAAIAGAPVTAWRNYDTIYTERYLGLPSENEAGYVAGSDVTYADKLRSTLLIVHNIEDDNVLFQNTVQMSDALEKADRKFSLIFYTEKTHGLTGPVRRHLYETMTDFFERELTE